MRNIPARLFPARCRVCGLTLPGSLGPKPSGGPSKDRSAWLCGRCDAELAPRMDNYCPSCGAIFHGQGGVHPCAECASGQGVAKAWDSLLFYGPYQGLLRELLLRFKFNGKLGHAGVLRRLAEQTWELRRGWDAPGPELITPVPLHPARLRKRGFNQSLELARSLAKRLGAPLSATALSRQRDTIPQAGLERKERLVNVRRAFSADTSQVAGKRVLLVDDILTTGSTVAEVADTLRRAGATRVDVLVLARTPGE